MQTVSVSCPLCIGAHSVIAQDGPFPQSLTVTCPVFGRLFTATVRLEVSTAEVPRYGHIQQGRLSPAAMAGI